MMIQCKAKTTKGGQCNAKPNASGFCFVHDPDRKSEADEARKLGGKHRRRVLNDTPFPEADTSTVRGLSQLLTVLMRETWQLEQSIARSRCLAYLAATQKSIIEAGNLEERIAKLEQQAEGKRQ